MVDRQKGRADEVASALRARGGRATAAEVDVRDLPGLKSLVDATIARSGAVDMFFNNAGIGVGGEIDGYAREDWDDVIDVNVRGVAYGIQAVYPHMIERGSGHIINTASMAGLVGAVGEGSYAAAKHAVVGLSKTLRIEAKRHGVRVSVLCPGAVRTPILTGGEFGRMNYDGLSRAHIEKLWALVRPMDVDVFAERAVRAILANEAIIVLPSWWKALWVPRARLARAERTPLGCPARQASKRHRGDGRSPAPGSPAVARPSRVVNAHDERVRDRNARR